MFRGTYAVKLDSKGRVVVPSRFRAALESGGHDSLVVTGHPDGYLLLMPRAGYEALERKVRELPDSGRHALYYKQTLIGLADDSVSFDKAGRIPLGAELRSHAAMGAEVSVVGMHDHIRLWGRERLDELHSHYRDNGEGGANVPDGWDGFTI